MSDVDDDMPSFEPGIGHNTPTELELAAGAKAELDKWLDEHPAITTEDEAREAKLVYDRAYASLKDLEAAKELETKPLHTAWQDALAKYRSPYNLFEGSVSRLMNMMQAFAREAKRKADAIAAEAARKLAEARAAAEEAERKEKEAIENASLGEIGAGVGQATEEADAAFQAFNQAAREARAAERDTNVKITGGFSRAIGIRAEKTLHLDDVSKAIAVLGVTEDIKAAVLKSARAYKKLKGSWPDGVREEIN